MSPKLTPDTADDARALGLLMAELADVSRDVVELHAELERLRAENGLLQRALEMACREPAQDGPEREP